MGVPGFFLWLLKKFRSRSILCDTVNNKVDVLYIDANCLIHPQCAIILEQYAYLKNVNELEELMIKQIIDYIQLLIDFVKPKCVYIAIDGVAPVAKIKQQRIRRFKSIQDKLIIDTIKRQFNIPTPPTIWSSTAITPGTVFMDKLSNRIEKHIRCFKFGKHYEVIFSPSNVFGEGEHKILQHIKTLLNRTSITKKSLIAPQEPSLRDANCGTSIIKKSLIAPQEPSLRDANCVIYGLDADLIFLSLSSGIHDIYLLREKSQINNNSDNNKKEELTFVNMEIVKSCITEMIHLPDYIFICYFMGNDFLPSFPSIDVQNNGLDTMLNCYKILNKSIITFDKKNIDVSIHVLYKFVSELAKLEDSYFKNDLPKHVAKRFRKRCKSYNRYDIALFQLNNLQFEIEDFVGLGIDSVDKYKARYYHHYFDSIRYDKHNIPKKIKHICKSYLHGLIWIAHYYFLKCPDQRWYYPYDHAPFISDFANYLKTRIEKKKTKISVLSNKNPINPLLQLTLVLPPLCNNLLPASYQSLTTSKESKIKDLYPDTFQEDLTNKTMWWKCIPHLPPLDIERVDNEIKKCKLTDYEKHRNRIGKEIHLLPNIFLSKTVP
jgi:5'-3' exonuclease